MMYGFNGEVPGPLIRVPQNATIIVRFHNQIDLPSSVHWHGVRLDNHYDGVPGVTQEPVAPGGSFIYKVHFPGRGHLLVPPARTRRYRAGIGLFGNVLVDSPDPDYYSPANTENMLVFSDLLVNGDSLIPVRQGSAGLCPDGPRRQRAVCKWANA